MSELVLAAVVALSPTNEQLAHCAPDIAPETMRSLIATESASQPFALNVNGSAKLQRQPATVTEAVVTARWLLQHGYNFDAGLMQVNSSNFASTQLTPDNVFDVCTNLRAGSRILKDAYAQSLAERLPTPAVLRALSRYNTGNGESGLRNGYVQKIVDAAAVTSTTETTGEPDLAPIPLSPVTAPGGGRHVKPIARPKPATPSTDVFGRANAIDVFTAPVANDGNVKP